MKSLGKLIFQGRVEAGEPAKETKERGQSSSGKARRVEKRRVSRSG